MEGPGIQTIGTITDPALVDPIAKSIGDVILNFGALEFSMLGLIHGLDAGPRELRGLAKEGFRAKKEVLVQLVEKSNLTRDEQAKIREALKLADEACKIRNIIAHNAVFIAGHYEEDIITQYGVLDVGAAMRTYYNEGQRQEFEPISLADIQAAAKMCGRAVVLLDEV